MLLVAFSSACEMASPASPGATDPSSVVRPTTITAVPTELKVAYIRDLSPDGALALTMPPLQAAELAFAVASLPSGVSVDLIPYDTDGDAARVEEASAEIAGDERFVAAIAAPGLGSQRSLAERLGRAGVPLVSLSARGTVERAPPGTWVRLVAPIEAQASALAAATAAIRSSRYGVCLASGPPDGTRYARRVRAELERAVSVTAIRGPAEIAASDCRIVVWTGDASGGGALALSFAGLQDPPILIGGPALLEPGFLETAGPAAEGAFSVCSCAHVSTSLDLAAQRFVQDFQAEFGSPPGPYAVEAWDAAHLLARGMREAGSDREALVAWLGGTGSLEGLGALYSFRGGELTDPSSGLQRYGVVGGRWVRLSRSGS